MKIFFFVDFFLLTYLITSLKLFFPENSSHVKKIESNIIIRGNSIITLSQNAQNLNPLPRYLHLFIFGSPLPHLECSDLKFSTPPPPPPSLPFLTKTKNFVLLYICSLLPSAPVNTTKKMFPELSPSSPEQKWY